MVKDDNNLKTASQEQADNTAVTQDPVDKNAPLTLAEAQATLEAPEGEIEANIEKQRILKDKEIAPDLTALKAEQDKAKQEIKKKAEEVIKEAEGEEPVIEAIPDKFKGKTPEELIKLSRETESYNTKLSQKNKELEKQLKDLEAINAKIEEYEKSAVVKDQQAIKANLPKYPEDELYYDDPIKYNKQVKAYNDAVLKAALDPLYGQNYGYEKAKVINALKDKTKDRVIPYADIEAEVEAHLKKNPELFDLHKLKAREVVYSEMLAERLPDKLEELKSKAKEEVQRELEEENADLSNAQVLSSDITTQKRVAKAVDLEETLAEEDGPKKVIDAYKKKFKIDIQA